MGAAEFLQSIRLASTQADRSVHPAHPASAAPGSLISANLAAIVGLPRVNFLMVTSCALSLARRKLRSVPSRASLVFCRWSIDLSISSIAVWKRRDASS